MNHHHSSLKSKTSISSKFTWLSLVLVDLVTIHNPLLLVWWVLHSEHHFSSFIVPKAIPNWPFLWAHLLPFLNYHCVWSFITWYKFLLVIHLPSQHCQIPHQAFPTLFIIKINLSIYLAEENQAIVLLIMVKRYFLVYNLSRNYNLILE